MKSAVESRIVLSEFFTLYWDTYEVGASCEDNTIKIKLVRIEEIRKMTKSAKFFKCIELIKQGFNEVRYCMENTMGKE